MKAPRPGRAPLKGDSRPAGGSARDWGGRELHVAARVLLLLQAARRQGLTGGHSSAHSEPAGSGCRGSSARRPEERAGRPRSLGTRLLRSGRPPSLCHHSSAGEGA